MKTVPDIISDCGGPLAIEAASKGALSHWAIRKWAANGIPNKHWPLVMSIDGVSADELLAANVALAKPLKVRAKTKRAA